MRLAAVVNVYLCVCACVCKSLYLPLNTKLERILKLRHGREYDQFLLEYALHNNIQCIQHRTTYIAHHSTFLLLPMPYSSYQFSVLNK